MSSESLPAIETTGLSHSYQKNFWERRRLALDSLDLRVGEGEIYGFLGANGAGKTTTIKILVGLQRQSAGGASIFGIPATDMECRRKIGFMPENPYFYEYLTARESLAFYGALCDLPREGSGKRIDGLLDFVDDAQRYILVGGIGPERLVHPAAGLHAVGAGSHREHGDLLHFINSS